MRLSANRGDPNRQVPDMQRPTTHPSPTPSSAKQTRKPGWVRTGILAGAIAVGTATLVFAFVPGARAVAAAHVGGHGQESMFASMHGGHSPEQMHAHFEKVLTEAGASDEQKQRIHAIMKEAMDAEHADIRTFHDSCGRLKTLLTAETIDDTAVTAIRAEQDQLLLATSHRLSDTMVAVAKVLTPAQRAKLGAEIDRMMEEHHMPHHGG
jgi:Spy/CpxP family protein refolding chaperone